MPLADTRQDLREWISLFSPSAMSVVFQQPKKGERCVSTCSRDAVCEESGSYADSRGKLRPL